MTAKKKPANVNDPDFLAEVGCVPMTDEAVSKMSMNPYDQLFLCRLMSMRDESVKEDMKKFLEDIYVKDNESLCKDVSEVVSRELAETLSPVWKTLENFATYQKQLVEDVGHIKERIGEMETSLSNVKKEVDDIRDVKLKKLWQTQRWWNIALRIAAAVAISAVITMILLNNHVSKKAQDAHDHTEIILR